MCFFTFNSISWLFNSHILKIRGENVTPKILKGSWDQSKGNSSHSLSVELLDEPIHNALVLVNRLGLSLPRKSVVMLTDRLDMTIAVE